MATRRVHRPYQRSPCQRQRIASSGAHGCPLGEKSRRSNNENRQSMGLAGFDTLEEKSMSKTTKQIGEWTIECNEFGRVNASNGTVETTVVTSAGDPHCACSCVTWEILDAARELRREWYEAPRLPDRWYTIGSGAVVDTACGMTHAIIVGGGRNVEVRETATPEQCAQIPAAQAWARHALERRMKGAK